MKPNKNVWYTISKNVSTLNRHNIYGKVNDNLIEVGANILVIAEPQLMRTSLVMNIKNQIYETNN